MSETKKIRVMVVDDHQVVRQGYSMFLKAFPDLEPVGEAANGREAVERCAALQPDVIIMDMLMPEMGGIEATQHILADYPKIRIIALTSYSDDKKLVQQALQAGATSYLFKDISIDELAQAIRDAYEGKTVLAPDATRMLIQLTTEPPETDFKLSERELEVLEWLSQGLNNRQIAEKLTVSRSTIKFHVSSILSKLNVSTRTEAVSVAHQHGLID
jgi:two-component system, NarL family, response regulator LiaR